jgi:hypothetical protein
MITIENKIMTISDKGEKVSVHLDTANRCATVVSNGNPVPLDITVSLALKIVMHAMKNDLYTLDELYPLSKLSRNKLRDTQTAQENLWGVSDE